MSNTEKKYCKCGKPAHPCYGEICEDCWTDNYRGVPRDRSIRNKVMQTYPKGGKKS